MKPPLAARLNRAPLFRRAVRVDGDRLVAPSLDRFVALWLIKLGLLGGASRRLLPSLVRPGDHVADIGANLGVFTLALSRLVGPAGRVDAFEPDSDLAALVKDHVDHSGCGNVQVHPVALGSAPGIARLHCSAWNRGDNRLDAFAGAGGAVDVAVETLDRVLAGAPLHFAKLDVQGREADVIEGMRETIARSLDLTLLLEYWPHGLCRAGADPPRLFARLREAGFRTFLPARDGSLRPIEAPPLADDASASRWVDVVATRRGGLMPPATVSPWPS